MVTIGIGRTSGPVTDADYESEFTPEQVDLVKDVIAMVNKVTNGKEDWYVVIDGVVIVPEIAGR